MTNFIHDITRFEVAPPAVFFLMLFSLLLALVHTLIFLALFKISFRPSKLLYILYPSIMAVTAFIDLRWIVLEFIVLFLFTFVLGICGMIFAFIKSVKLSQKERHRFRKKHHIPRKPLRKKILGGFFSLLFILVFYVNPGLFVLSIFLILPILSLILPSKRNRFFKYQQLLPTSKIRSVAMGLAELRGELIAGDALLSSPIKSKRCIGFQYSIEKVSTDKDGKKSYRTIFNETKCNPFRLKDATGTISVNPENMDLYQLDIDERYQSGGKRYTQRLLMPKDQVLIVGKIGLQNNIPVLQYEPIKKVFGIAPYHYITTYNTFKPLLNRFLSFTSIFGFFVALILMSTIVIRQDYIGITFTPTGHNFVLLNNQSHNKLKDIHKSQNRKNKIITPQQTNPDTAVQRAKEDELPPEVHIETIELPDIPSNTTKKKTK
ncbi:hypothetical protein [Sinomicrobium sp.]